MDLINKSGAAATSRRFILLSVFLGYTYNVESFHLEVGNVLYLFISAGVSFRTEYCVEIVSPIPERYWKVVQPLGMYSSSLWHNSK